MDRGAAARNDAAYLATWTLIGGSGKQACQRNIGNFKFGTEEISLENGRKDRARGTRESSLWELLKTRDFRLLWGAGTLSAIGDQFDLIAFPWLVLLLRSCFKRVRLMQAVVP